MLSLMGMFRNNGANFSRQETEQDLFRSGYSRIINVMDSIKISYDGSDYLGEFISFTVEEDAEHPFKLRYSFEYVINGIRADSARVEGHIRTDDYNVNTPIILGEQGSDRKLGTIIQVDEQAIRDNAFIGLKDTAARSDELQELGSAALTSGSAANGADIRGSAPATNTSGDPGKNTNNLTELQYTSGGRVARKESTVKRQLDNTRRLNENVALNLPTQNLTAEQALADINAAANGTVTVTDMNGILMMENVVGNAFTGDSFASNPNSTARGMTQIIEGTYNKDIAGNENFVELMGSYGYTREEIMGAHTTRDASGNVTGYGILDTDPFFGYMAGAFYVANSLEPQIRRDNYQPTPQVVGLAYHNGPSGYKNLVRQAGADYVVTIDKYIEYLEDPNKSTNDLRN
jgi:hypothetical protein